jgi:hypothetical protein
MQTDGIHPWGVTSPIEANFTPGGQFSPLGAQLKRSSDTTREVTTKRGRRGILFYAWGQCNDHNFQ